MTKKQFEELEDRVKKIEKQLEEQNIFRQVSDMEARRTKEGPAFCPSVEDTKTLMKLQEIKCRQFLGIN